MGGGSGLLSSLRLRKNKKNPAKQENRARKTHPALGAGGVAITCGSSSRSLFRTRHDVDSLLDVTSMPSAVESITCANSTSSLTTDPQHHHQQGGALRDSSKPFDEILSSSVTDTALAPPLTPPRESSEKNSSVTQESPTVSVPPSPFGTPGSGRIRGKEVASKAAFYEAKSVANSPAPSSLNSSFSSLSPPPSMNKRSTLRHRDFWQTVLHQVGSEDDEGENNAGRITSSSCEVLKKSQWLKTAFTPMGGGNMPGLDDYEDESSSRTQDMTETAMEEDESVAAASTWSSHSHIYLRATPPRPSEGPPPILTAHDQAWKDAYQVWFERGLLPWDPQAKQGGDEKQQQQQRNEDAPGRYRHQSSTVGRALVEEKQEPDEQDMFHDSFMAHDDDVEPEEERIRSAIKGMETAAPPVASPGSVQASRQRHRNLTRSCPLLTVFGGHTSVTSNCTSSPPLPTSVSTTTPVSSAPPSSLSFVQSPSQAYGNYVAAYTAYVQDRHNPAKASAHLEARRLLELSRMQRQPL